MLVIWKDSSLRGQVAVPGFSKRDMAEPGGVRHINGHFSP